ncbi:MAG: 23S rRNA (uracil(1939)-C(5))-methyltransferase RlmD, partial [Luteibaculum sp.]
LEGNILEIEKESSLRTQAKCVHFGLCGGCKWQHVRYKEQLQFKWQQVKDALDRIGKVSYPKINPILGAPQQFAYRNKMEYTATANRWLTQDEVDSNENLDRDGMGFHIPGRFDRVFHMSECHLAPNTSNRIRDFIYDKAKELGISFYDIREQSGCLRTVMIRSNSANEWMFFITVQNPEISVLETLLKAIQEEFPEVKSLNYAVNNKKNDSFYDLEIVTFSGEPVIQENLAGLNFRIHPKSFFQTNTEQAKALYDLTLKYCNLEGGEVVYDLYTGTGTIACYLAQKANKVVGVESVPEAIEDAIKNAEQNQISNCEFLVGDMKEVFTSDFQETHGKADVIVCDPPRAGMHEDVVKQLLQIEAKRIVYVSCNPATQARDLSLLCEKYQIVEVQPVDMFPHTHHVENIVVLELSK